MAHAHQVTCDTTLDGKSIKGLKVQVITPFSSKPNSTDVKKALEAQYAGKRIGGIFNIQSS
jgi:hypothetical protein